MQFISVTDRNGTWIVVHISDYRAYEAGDITLDDLIDMAVSCGDRFSWPGRDATRAAFEAECDGLNPATRTRR